MRASNDSERIVISGEDLVMPTPETLATKTSDPAIFLSVTSNPLYWVGTRVSAVAQGYQMFRPMQFEVSYVPQVPVTYSGNVIYGTLFSDGREMSSLQQSLASSNGGGITPCYSPAKSRVRLGAQLPQRLFRVKGNASDPQVNPFRWVATYSGSNPEGSSTSAPGWVVVKWRYEFVNGVGNGGENVYSIYTTPTASHNLLQLHLSSVGLRSERALSPLFGTVIGVLKIAGIQILRNIAVLFLENTKALAGTDSTLFGAGSIAAVQPPSKQEANETQTTTIRDNVGNEWEVPDDTPVVIYQQGPQVSIGGETPAQSIELVNIQYKGTSWTDTSMEYDLNLVQTMEKNIYAGNMDATVQVQVEFDNALRVYTVTLGWLKAATTVPATGVTFRIIGKDASDNEYTLFTLENSIALPSSILAQNTSFIYTIPNPDLKFIPKSV